MRKGNPVIQTVVPEELRRWLEAYAPTLNRTVSNFVAYLIMEECHRVRDKAQEKARRELETARGYDLL